MENILPCAIQMTVSISCGQWGYCGTDAEFCNCKDCVDYEAHPEFVDQKAPDEVLNIINIILSFFGVACNQFQIIAHYFLGD